MKRKILDIAVPVVFVLALIVICFFWDCELDLYMTILAVVVLLVTALTTYIQNKKIKELEKSIEEE